MQAGLVVSYKILTVIMQLFQGLKLADARRKVPATFRVRVGYF